MNTNLSPRSHKKAQNASRLPLQMSSSKVVLKKEASLGTLSKLSAWDARMNINTVKTTPKKMSAIMRLKLDLEQGGFSMQKLRMLEVTAA